MSLAKRVIGNCLLAFASLAPILFHRAPSLHSEVQLVLLPGAGMWFGKTPLSSWRVVDLSPCFDKAFPHYSEWHFATDGHWNEAGNMVAAHCLYRQLEGLLGLPVRRDKDLSSARYAYYRAFQETTGAEVERWMPGAPWVVPGPSPAPPPPTRRNAFVAATKGSAKTTKGVANASCKPLRPPNRCCALCGTST